MAYLTSQPGSDTDARTAAAYHQLGLVAHKRWRMEEAEEYFQKSLQILSVNLVFLDPIVQLVVQMMTNPSGVFLWLTYLLHFKLSHDLPENPIDTFS